MKAIFNIILMGWNQFTDWCIISLMSRLIVGILILISINIVSVNPYFGLLIAIFGEEFCKRHLLRGCNLKNYMLIITVYSIINIIVIQLLNIYNGYSVVVSAKFALISAGSGFLTGIYYLLKIKFPKLNQYLLIQGILIRIGLFLSLISIWM